MFQCMIKKTMLVLLIVLLLMFVAGCEENKEHPLTDRLEKIPTDITKRHPETDLHPPVLHSAEFDAPIPLDGPINTAGLEDAPFVTEDGNTLYFFFTPDARIDPSKQLLDEVTGIWVSHKIEGIWQYSERVWLQEPGKLALDGCPMLYQDTLWFCSAREGYTGVQLFHAPVGPMMWMHAEFAGDQFMTEFDMGEMHRHGDTIYFHSTRTGGQGGYDLWSITLVEGSWTDPVNLANLNTEAHESLPFVTYDGNELWFTRTYMGTPGLYRSLWVEGVWQTPELIMSMFAGEPTLDGDGNLYFVHHYFENDQMIEADIYVAYRISDET